MRSRLIIGLAAGATSLTALTACQGLKEALTAHVDVVARAGSQELSVNHLGDLLGLMGRRDAIVRSAHDKSRRQ